VPRCEGSGPGSFSELPFKESHPPAREKPVWSSGNEARVAGPDGRPVQKIFYASGEPIRVWEDFRVDARD